MSLTYRRCLGATVACVVLVAVALAGALWTSGDGESKGTVAVLVTTEEVMSGTKITMDLVRERWLSTSTVLRDLVTVDDVRSGITTVRAMRPNEAVTSASVQHIGDRSATAAQTAEGERGTWVSLLVAAIAVSFAGGVGVLRRRCHHHRSRPFASATRKKEEHESVACPPDIEMWARRQLDLFLYELGPGPSARTPMALEISEQTGIEVLWDRPQDVPTLGAWRSADGGWSSRMDYDPASPLPPAPPTCMAALVNIGQRDGRELLVNLEAFGNLTIDGPEEHTRTLMNLVQHQLSPLSGVASATDSTINPVRADALIGHGPPKQPLSARSRRSAATAERTTGPVATANANARIEISAAGDSARFEPLGIDFTPARRMTAAAPAPVVGAFDTSEFSNDDPNVGENPSLPTAEPEGGFAQVPPTLFDIEHDVFSASGERQLESRHQPRIPAEAESERRTGPVAAATQTEPIVNSYDRLLGTQLSDTRILVRVLGVPSVPDRPDIGRREIILVVLLACRGGTFAASAAQDALWGGKPVEPKTVWNFVTAVRRALGDIEDGRPVMPAADRTRGTLRLDPCVVTDLELLRRTVGASTGMPSSEAIATLNDALALIEGPPFDGAGYDWAHRDQDVSEAARVIVRAVEQLVTLALEAGQYDVARHAISRGLRGLPGDEHLYRLRMRLEAHAGNTLGIVSAYKELCVYLADLGLEPSPDTATLYNELRLPLRTSPGD
jgi:DNA-binding SARP family transcriptional activator